MTWWHISVLLFMLFNSHAGQLFYWCACNCLLALQVLVSISIHLRDTSIYTIIIGEHILKTKFSWKQNRWSHNVRIQDVILYIQPDLHISLKRIICKQSNAKMVCSTKNEVTKLKVVHMYNRHSHVKVHSKSEPSLKPCLPQGLPLPEALAESQFKQKN